MPEPSIRIGQAASVQGARLNTDGEGVASLNGMTLFVPNLLPGEWATVRVTAVEKRYARAVVLSHESSGEETGQSFHSLSPHRQTPKCPVFELCGGCQMQHLSYEHQLTHKRQVVEDALARIGHLSGVVVAPTLGMDHPWRYRNQVQVPITYDSVGRRYVAGFFAAGSHEIIPTEVCHLISQGMENSLVRMVELLTHQSRQYGGDLGVHHLILRESLTNGDRMVVYVLKSDPSKEPQKAVMRTLFTRTRDLLDMNTVAYTIQPKTSGPVWGRTVEVVEGTGVLQEDVLGMKYLISPRSFFQTNTSQTRVLYEQALRMAQLHGDETVLDAYCGTGTMSLLFAQSARRVVGIESVAPAIVDARRNAAHNDVTNAEFHVGLVEQELPRLLKAGLSIDVAVVDPPRKGCKPAVLNALLSQPSIRRIVYVSCNPSTLARDLRLLVDGGSEIGQVQPVDMFPHTSHVECVVRLNRSCSPIKFP